MSGSRGSAMRVLTVVFWTAVAVSVVHYTDNYVNYSAFPQVEDGLNPSRPVVPIAWFVFTPAGIAGYLAFRRGRLRPAALLLGFYSTSGLVGIGHYVAPGMTDAVWWRQAHVVADIALGAAVLACAVWIARRSRELHGEPA